MLPHNRFGFVVSKRVHKRASVRNRTKRRFRACIESMHPAIRPGYDLLFILRQPMLSTEAHEICAIIATILKKHTLLK